MAYASWSVVFGEQPSAAKWNILGTNDASFNDGTGIATNAIKPSHLNSTQSTSSWAYAAYTPSWTGGSPAIGNGVLAGRYIVIGKMVNFYINLLAGSTTTFGSGTWSLSLPVTASGNIGLKTGIGTWSGEDSGVQGYYGTVQYVTTTTINLLYHNKDIHGAGLGVGQLTPFGWGNADFIRISGTYEAA